MNGITKEMVNGFNEIMSEKGSIVRLFVRHNTVDIKLVGDPYLNMDDQIINPSKTFYAELEKYFLDNKVSINYNNTWSCFWSSNSIGEIQ